MRSKEKELKEAKGTYRPDKEKQPYTPEVAQDLTAPTVLKEDARRLWDEIAPSLGSDRILTELDKRNLMAYCHEMARYWRLQKELEGEDEVFELTDKTGTVVVNYRVNPKVELSDRALVNAYKLGLQFGLTPLSRTKLGTVKKKTSTPAEENIGKLNALRGKVIAMRKSG